MSERAIRMTKEKIRGNWGLFRAVNCQSRIGLTPEPTIWKDCVSATAGAKRAKT